MSETYSEDLVYTPQVSNHSTIVMRNLSPQQAGSVTTSITSTVGPTEFLISSSVFNFAKNRLNYTIRIPEANGKYTWTNANMITQIARIVCYDSQTNAQICDVSNFDKFSTMVLPAGTKLDDLLSKSFVSASPATGAAASYLRTVEDITKSNLTTNYTGQTTGDIGPYAPYTGRRQFYISPVGDGSNNGDAYLDVSIPFEAFKLTALSVDKMVYSPSTIVLQIYWNSANQYTFTANSASDTTTAQVCATAPTISNISLSLANEGNLAIISQIISKVQSGGGISMPIAYPNVVKQSISSTTSHSYNLNLSKAYGNRVLAVITAPFAAAATTANLYHARGLLTTYNTYINAVALRYPAGFDCTKSQDYTLANKDYIDKSCIQALGEYVNAEWLHVDSFCNKPVWKMDKDQTMIDGLDVSQTQTWQIQATTSSAVALVWVSAIIGSRMMSFTSNGVIIS